jgi:hypothetical protein
LKVKSPGMLHVTVLADEYSQVRCTVRPYILKLPVYARKARASCLLGQCLSLLALHHFPMLLENGARKRQSSLLLRIPCASSRDIHLRTKLGLLRDESASVPLYQAEIRQDYCSFELYRSCFRRCHSQITCRSLYPVERR